MAVKIVTDSSAYLDNELVKMYDIQVIPLIVNYNNQSIKETEINNTQFYEWMATENFPTTSQPSPMEIQQAFSRLLEEGHDICAIFISAKFSGTFLSALNAKNICLERYPERKIEIIDSQGACMSNVVLNAAQRAIEGEELELIVKKAEEMISKSNFLFVPAVLDYLKKGGRIGGARYLLGTILDIKPLLTIKGGEIAVVDKVRNKKKAIEKMISILEQDIVNNEVEGLTVGHVFCPTEAQELADLLKTRFAREVKLKSIGPVIGMHIGPGTIGIGYYLK